jgi:hypothetical protein
VPDYIEPTLGWRAWAVVQQRGRFRLRSVVFDTIWPPGTELTADCNHLWTRLRRRLPWRMDLVHDVPVRNCSCGIHAANDPELAAEYLYLYSDVHQPHVLCRAIGVVSLWGLVVEGETGWRAACAYPKRILLPRSQRRADVEAIRDGLTDYRVPVEILDERDTSVGRAVWRVGRHRYRRWRPAQGS